MSAYDWSRFTVRINVNAPVDELYRAWATRSGIEHWFLRWSNYRSLDGLMKNPDDYVQKNDIYQWRWYGYPDSATEEGTILEANGKDLFRFSFGKAGICTITIKEEVGYHIVELVQYQIPSDEKGMQYYHVGCKTGWTFYFANMKSMLEGGMDLRNKDERLQEVINS